MFLRTSLAIAMIASVALPGVASAQPVGPGPMGPGPIVEEFDGPFDGKPGGKPGPHRLKREGPPPVEREIAGPGRIPSADQIRRKLEAPVLRPLRRSERVTVREFKRRPELRRAAPSIDIQAINFAFASAEIPYSQFGKVEIIADAIDGLLRRDPGARVLIEGHTDAVGSFASNQRLSEARAATLKRVLVREFDIPGYALETVGYGEEFLVVPTQYEDWHNRRVTLVRMDGFVTQ